VDSASVPDPRKARLRSIFTLPLLCCYATVQRLVRWAAAAHATLTSLARSGRRRGRRQL